MGRPRERPAPRDQNSNTLRRTRQSASAHRNSSEPPLASSAGRCGGDSPLCRSHRQRPAPLRGRGANLRTITPVHWRASRSTHPRSRKSAPWAAGTPRTPQPYHATQAHRECTRRDTRHLVSPAPIACFRLYAPGVRSPRHSVPSPRAFTASSSYRLRRAGAPPRAQHAGAANPQRLSSQRPHPRRLAARGNRATAPAPHSNKQTPPSHPPTPPHTPQIVGPPNTPPAA